MQPMTSTISSGELCKQQGICTSFTCKEAILSDMATSMKHLPIYPSKFHDFVQQLTVIRMVKRSPASIKPEGTIVHRLDLVLSHLNAIHINHILILFHLCVSLKAVFPLEILLENILHAFSSLHTNVPCATYPILLLKLLTSFLHV